MADAPPSIGGTAPPSGQEILARAAAQREEDQQLAESLMALPTLRSEALGNLAAALATAQGEIENAVRDSKNPFFKSKYASLAAVRDACKGPLSKAGIACLQLPTNRGRVVIIPTLLVHGGSGEWIESRLMLTAKDDSPQSIVAAVTYGRRAGLAAMSGVAPEDDDGETASREKPGDGVKWDKGSTSLQGPSINIDQWR